MDITPRTVRLFINGVLQPVYMSGLPNSVQFFFAFSYPNDSVSVISMRNLSIPTNTSISGAQEVLWS
ncbi:MAG: hypothetical protein EZS28_042702 [Streblomastix strix]|uniref:Uncharacterized protein n=1 Tax=Streblomastix strix TaxID=222440 RepID=A0A5J4TV67_9EUKA|nr:MAG: hypothetical protein EZS28_042702 [Streblomastix strix]